MSHFESTYFCWLFSNTYFIGEEFLHYENANIPMKSSNIANALPDYIRNKSINSKLQILEQMNVTDDNIQTNLLEESYAEGDSLAFLDNDHPNKRAELDNRISLIMRDSGYLNNYENKLNSKFDLPKPSANSKAVPK